MLTIIHGKVCSGRHEKGALAARSSRGKYVMFLSCRDFFVVRHSKLGQKKLVQTKLEDSFPPVSFPHLFGAQHDPLALPAPVVPRLRQVLRPGLESGCVVLVGVVLAEGVEAGGPHLRAGMAAVQAEVGHGVGHLWGASKFFYTLCPLGPSFTLHTLLSSRADGSWEKIGSE